MIIHVVEQGDTVWKIANKYGVSPQKIITDNNLIDPDYLLIGQALVILVPDIVHIVRYGDTLSQIAMQYNTTVTTLLQNNPTLLDDPTLYVGEEIVISYKGDKLGSINVNGYAYPNINKDLLLKVLPYLTTLTIFGYGFTPDGNLIEINDQPLIELALENKVAPIMLLSSITESGTFDTERASTLFNNIDLQNKLIEEIIQTMKQKKYYGLDVDFEFINPKDREAYNAFLKNITQKLNAEGFTVNVDLAPKTSATQEGLLYEAHDYGTIGDISNTVLLMTYEWGYLYGPPLAVAPLNKVTEVVDYALTEIPNNKILMGIPNYAYDWTLPFVKGLSIANLIGNETVLQIARDFGAEIQYDEVAQSPYFNYWDTDNKEHVVWFEDPRSIQAKLNLINDKGLLGAGYWNLMKPFSQNWAVLNSIFDINKMIE